MRVALEHGHPVLQILFILLLLTLIAFAIEGCPALGKQKYYENQKATAEFYNPGLIVYR